MAQALSWRAETGDVGLPRMWLANMWLAELGMWLALLLTHDSWPAEV